MLKVLNIVFVPPFAEAAMAKFARRSFCSISVRTVWLVGSWRLKTVLFEATVTGDEGEAVYDGGACGADFWGGGGNGRA